MGQLLYVWGAAPFLLYNSLPFANLNPEWYIIT